jgi:hypothetical protein
MHNSDFAALKRSVGSKIYLDRNGSSVGKASFSSIVVEGENGPIEVKVDPFAPLGKVFLLKKDEFSLYSLNGAPHLKKDDGQNYARLAADDAIEARWAFYGNWKLTNPAPQIKITNYGD